MVMSNMKKYLFHLTGKNSFLNIRVQDENHFTKNKWLCYVALMIILIITFYPFFFTGFGCADDLGFFITLKSGIVSLNRINMAEYAGRFFGLIVYPINIIPYISDNPIVVKLFHHIPLVSGFILFAIILYKLIRSKEMSFFYFLVFMIIAQASRHTTLFLNYPFYFTFSFDLLLLSFIFLINYIKRQRKYQLVVSVVLFTVGLLFYESYLLYLVFLVIAIFVFPYQRDKTLSLNLRKSLITFLPFLTVGILYIAVYFIYRNYHPSQYEGASFDFKNITFPHFFTAIWKLSYTSYPLTVFNESRNFFTEKSELIRGYSPVVLQIILHARIEWIIKGICVAICSFILLTSISRFNFKTLLSGICFAILLIFIPPIPQAFTVKYIIATVQNNMLGYICTFFSLFGTVLLITIIVSYLINLLNFNRLLKRIVILLSTIVFFSFSVLTDLTNYTVAKDVRSANLRLYAMDELIKTDMFLSIPPHSIFYTNDLYNNISHCAGGLTEQNFNWATYMFTKTAIKYKSARNYRDIDVSGEDSAKPVYYLSMLQAEKSEEIMLILAKLPPRGKTDTLPGRFTDKVWVLYYSLYKIFTVSFRVKDDSGNTNTELKVKHIVQTTLPGKNFEMTICNTQKKEAATFFSISMPDIDLKSIRISDIVDKDCLVFYL
jgi:hypothetical protein